MQTEALLHAPEAATQPTLVVERLKAYYTTKAFGIDRDIRAVDDISLAVAKGEIYGVAGESSSGKTSLIKTIVGAIRPPLHVVDGTVRFNFSGQSYDIHDMKPDKLQAIRWRHLSYIMQGSMNVLNPVRRIKYSFHDFAFSHMGLDRATFWDKGAGPPQETGSRPRRARQLPPPAVRRHASANHHRACHRLHAGIHRRRRADDSA